MNRGECEGLFDYQGLPGSRASISQHSGSVHYLESKGLVNHDTFWNVTVADPEELRGEVDSQTAA